MKRNIVITALLAALLALAGCGGGGGGSPLLTPVGTTAEQLEMAVMELEKALMDAEDAETPTEDQIAGITREYTELQKAIKEAADGVNTKTAQMLIDGDGTVKSVTERLAEINKKANQMAEVEPDDGNKNNDNEKTEITLNPSLSGTLATSFSGSIDSDDNQDEYTLTIEEPGTLTISTGATGPNIRVFDADGKEIPGREGSWVVIIDQSILDKGPVTIRIFGGTTGDYEAIATFVSTSGAIRIVQPRPIPSTMQEGSADIVYARSEADKVQAGTTYRTLSVAIDRTFGSNPGVVLSAAPDPHVASVTPQADGGADAVFMIGGQEVPVSFSRAKFRELEYPETLVRVESTVYQLENIGLSRSNPLNKDYFKLAYWYYAPDEESSRPFYDGELVYGARTSLDNPLTELTGGTTATYSGYFSGRNLPNDGERPRYATHRSHLWGELELSANFDTLKISGTVDNLHVRYPEGYDEEGNRNPLRDFVEWPKSTSIVIHEGDIARGRYVLRWEGVDTNPANPSITSAGGFSGNMAGDFYGPNAEETAGVFNGSRSDADGTDYVFGIFGAQTAPLQ